MIKVKLHCNWTHDLDLRETLNRCAPRGDYRWKNMVMTADGDYDFFVIFNHAQHNDFSAHKTILFDCETQTTRRRYAESGAMPDVSSLYKHFSTTSNHNFFVWYSSLKYLDYQNEGLFTKDKEISGIVSENQRLPGHGLRYRFLSYLDELPSYDHYGRGNLQFLKSYHGNLERKEDGLLRYRYNFNAENDYELNYFTEKIIDPILCETLCFYDGCPNIEQFINPRAFVRIDLRDPRHALTVVKDCISGKEWEARIKAIREEKRRLMTDFNPLNVLWKVITGDL
jgi:hypothetical protein